MKRELLCETCAAESMKRFPPHPYPGEYVKHVAGTLKRTRPDGDIVINGVALPWSGPCICDECSARMPRGVRAVARTIGVVGDYAAWEGTYLDP